MNEDQKFITDEISKSSDKLELKWISMSSKFSSVCIKCNGEINQGESILWCKGKGAKHKTCPIQQNNDDFGITVIDNESPKEWIDIKQYSYDTLQKMNNCQCCNIDVSDRSKRYIDDDRLVCVNCFGK